jgi:hypothetical protein
MNRFFLAFAAILTSGIFAFSYLKEWASIRLVGQKLILKPSEEIVYPYFHHSDELYLRVTLVFGVVFLLLFLASVYFVYQKNEKKVFLTFVLTMFAILALMINGAIK